MMEIREATSNDYDAVWDIFKQVIATGDTYVFSPETPKKDLLKYWFAPYMKTFVLTEDDQILGSYVLKPNQVDLGSHIANGSYMVNPQFQGKGIGKLLCSHSLEMTKALGYQAIQFNIVVSTNEAAVHLWQKFGFQIIGTIPKGFNHQKLGYVDAYIMFREV
jgi:L-amino acid N-acyltransferase YncA